MLELVCVSEAKENVKHPEWDAKNVDEDTDRGKHHHDVVAGRVAGLVPSAHRFRMGYMHAA